MHIESLQIFWTLVLLCTINSEPLCQCPFCYCQPVCNYVEWTVVKPWCTSRIGILLRILGFYNLKVPTTFFTCTAPIMIFCIRWARYFILCKIYDNDHIMQSLVYDLMKVFFLLECGLMMLRRMPAKNNFLPRHMTVTDITENRYDSHNLKYFIQDHVTTFQVQPMIFIGLFFIHISSIELYRIIIYFLAFLASVTASPAAANGPTDMRFGMEVCFGCGMLIFAKSGS